MALSAKERAERAAKRQETRMKHEQINKALEQILGTTPTVTYDKAVGGALKVEVQYADITFDKMFKVSKLLKTRQLNVTPEKRSGGYCDTWYCDTCAYSYTVSVLYITEADLNDPDFEGVEALPED